MTTSKLADTDTTMKTPIRLGLACSCMVFSTLLLGACGKPELTPPVAAMPEPPPSVAAPAPPSASDQLQASLTALGATHTEHGWGILLSSATFKPGQTAFAPEDTARLEKIQDLLKSSGKVRVLVRAYTDDRGSKSRNLHISQMRANAVLRNLTEGGVDGGRIQAQGVGEDAPIATNATIAGRLQNRRVELVFSDAEGKFAPTAVGEAAT